MFAKAKVIKETKNIPNLILKIETFDKTLVKLEQKCKKSFGNKHLLNKLGTSRDFRIMLGNLEKENETNNEEEEETEESEMSIGTVLQTKPCKFFLRSGHSIIIKGAPSSFV